MESSRWRCPGPANQDVAPVPERSAGRGRRILVIGAGPGGLLAALFLRRRGYDVAVYEKRGDFREADPHSEHYKVGLGLMYRGIKHLQRAGIARDELQECGVRVNRYQFVGRGRSVVMPVADGQAILSLHRRLLMRLLLTRALERGVELHFSHSLTDIDFATTRAMFATPDGNVAAAGEAIIGADGAYSTTRTLMQRRAPRFSISQNYYQRGWKSITLDRASEHGFQPDHVSFYGGDALIHAGAIPGDKRIFTVCLPYAGNPSLTMLDSDDIHGFFDRHIPALAAGHPDIVAAFRHSPVGDFVSVQCDRFHHGRVILLGDSAHAMVPFLGQGMNCALEDAGVLHDLVEHHRDDWAQIPRAFTGARKPHADAISQMSLSHYHVLNSSKPTYMARMLYQSAMHRRFRRWYRMDLSKALSVTDIPFAEIKRMQERQNTWYRFGRM